MKSNLRSQLSRRNFIQTALVGSIGALAGCSTSSSKMSALSSSSQSPIYDIPSEFYGTLGIVPENGSVKAWITRCKPKLPQIVLTTTIFNLPIKYFPQRILALDNIVLAGSPLPRIIADWRGNPQFFKQVVTLDVPSQILTLIVLEQTPAGTWQSHNSIQTVAPALPPPYTDYHMVWSPTWYADTPYGVCPACPPNRQRIGKD